jgi:uncharacterized protein (DUF2336 family)
VSGMQTADGIYDRLENWGRPLSYDEARSLLADPSIEVRARLAARPDAPPEVLYYLASDTSPRVRRAVAANLETPIHAELMLSRDADDGVRLALAEKIATVADMRSADARPGRAKLFFELLKALARDELARIRRVIAQAIKEIANIPRDIVRLLAQDPNPEVAAPVLERSPVLRERDLLEAIEERPASLVVTAVAKRAELGPRVSDAVVATGDEAGIAALLANESAQIREETLDRIIEQAAKVKAWQAPLVERPSLSPSAASRLARFVEGPLAEKLARRSGVGTSLGVAEAAAALEAGAPNPAIVAPAPGKADRGIETGGPGEGRPGETRRNEARRNEAKSGEAEESVAADAALERAKALLAAGKLDEDAVASAIAARERAFVVAALAVKAELPIGLVKKIMRVGGAKGITALVWKAGFGMRLATQLQTRLAGIAPNKALYAKEGVAFPLSQDDMLWQLEFFGAV